MNDSDDGVLEELASLPTMAHPTAAPSGDEVALYYDVTGRNELHVVDTDSGELSRWSDGEVPRNARWFVAWDADGERVFFHLDDNGDEQNDIYALSRDGSVEPVVEMDGQVVVHDVGDDGDTLLVGSTRDGQMNVYRHDLASDETTKITDYDRAVWGSLLSPDGDRIAYSTNETDDYDNKDVYVANADGSEPRNLEIGEVGAEATPADWGPEGRRLLVGDNTEDLGRIGVYAVEDDEVTWYGDGDHEESPVAFLPDGERVLATRSRDALQLPVVYDLETGEGRELDVPEGVSSFGRMHTGGVSVGDDRIILQHTTPTRRPELLAYDLESDEYEPLLEAEYGPFDADDFADAEYFTFDSDGVPETSAEAVDHDPYEELEIGALLYDSGERPSPLIVNPHGGPRARDTKSFDLYTQVLVSQGFSVLQVNYRGSSGRGREFVEALIDDWAGAEQGDVAGAAEHVLERHDWIDEDRVVVFGGSYGGYSAYWQLVQYPELYEAGIAWIGLTDLEDMFENTMPHFRTELMEKYLGTPDENPDLYEERSPVTHADNLDAPIYLVHGVNDRRVPVSQARIFREALEERGLEAGPDGAFEYHELGEEGHASSDQEQKLRLFRLLTDFLDRRVGTETAD
ncbi:prolyl oligopeptidase family serine peptidase [Natronorubrum sp. JWXQ-INN-674]|uniref:Prolyl oligopeptidase family serine peptidase n=1 Tax=Natronorubrum halalkaliphilum TaxID=2691917 RepID=A0A6B0VHY1_9EURY|nr:prolyl oligopeptidase family serine peptidase [Natronorubrum halalkaliphilum]MXV61114.1 prolyl oligopeptidase family serine peptidase [Natronorubrum halalkaliphilum]